MNEAGAKHALVRGRDHRLLGAYSVETVGTSVALGISAGAHAKPSMDANEDAGAVVRGARADLLVVADGHFGSEASELAVDHVLAELGDDPPAADLDDARLVELFFEVGFAVQRDSTRAGAPHPNARTTLALALVTDATVQWASMGDSCVALATHESAARLDIPRSAYLGQRFALADVAAALTRGRSPRGAADYVLVASDGLVDVLASDAHDLVAAAASHGGAADAALITETLLRLALERETRDAVTVAVSRRSHSS